MNYWIDELTAADWDAVRAIYLQGIAVGLATFETEAPPWERWDAGHHAFARLAARGEGGLLGWTALGPVSARAAYRGSLDSSATLEQRAASASLAHKLAPWSAQYGRRSQLLSAWVLGEQQLGRGDYNAAVDTLDAAYRLDIGNSELLALYRRAQETQSLETNRKAHLQHGHEGPGGTLAPGDVER